MFPRFLVCLLSAAALPVAYGQEVGSLMESLKSDDWKIREHACFQLKAYLPDQKVQAAIIQLLKKENSEKAVPLRVLRERVPRGEEGGEYFRDLLQTVGSFGTKEGAIALAGAAGHGTIVTNPLLQWPNEVLSILLQQMAYSESELLRDGSAFELEQILISPRARAKLTGDAISSIAEAFQRLSADKEPLLRLSAVHGLAAIGGPVGLRALRTVARDDPDPKVRSAAVAAVSELEKRHKE